MTQLAPHQQRVVDEKTELAERLGKLLAFFQSPIFAGLDPAEQSRLRNQARFMDGYAAVLEERIAAFTAPQGHHLGALVDRFLSWPLPDNFSPDAGVYFKPPSHMANWPTGTNLLTAEQAKAMLQHVLGG